MTVHETDPNATPLPSDSDGYSSIMAADRIEPFDAAKAYITAIDFSRMKHNMTAREDDVGWSQEKCDWVERQYKRWLVLRRMREDLHLPPSIEIDVFWHHHILDTRAYFRDTAKIFGYYNHHFPYFGARGPADLDALNNAFANNTCALFEQVFGVPPLDYPRQHDE